MSKKETSMQGTYDSWFKIGNEHYEKGEFEEAITCFEKSDKILAREKY